ncbi:hypothetical protein [Aureimonas ureilytica]|uniref:hypothetical protein n=1 Tax=Aureimonas ureilytica TaxID=401562 RepID=UPI00035F3936|nr:hypothetical protein [Aureimonas ureilytica]
MAAFDNVWASDDDALITTPTAAQVREGFSCGRADPGLFNWLFQQVQSAINGLDLSGVASRFRRISTTEGISGGGTLEEDRTLRLNFLGLEAKETASGADVIAVFDPVANAHRRQTRAQFVAGLGGSGGSLITTGANIGDGTGQVFSAVATDTMQFRTLKNGGGLAITTTGNVVNVALADRGADLTFA